MSSVAAGTARPIESAPATGAQAWTLLGCTLIAAFDGLDVLVMALAAPVLAEQWQLDARAIGLLLGTAPIGMAIGAATLAPLADRIGRKRLLLLACALAGVGTLASSFTSAFGPLALTRLVTGLGIGAALPTLTTLTSEVAPERWRNLYIGIVTNGYSIGTIGGAMMAGALIAAWGWQGLFWVGGIGPLLLIPLLWVTLPESTYFLATRRGTPAAVDAGSSRSTLGEVLGGDLRPVGARPEADPVAHHDAVLGRQLECCRGAQQFGPLRGRQLQRSAAVRLGATAHEAVGVPGYGIEQWGEVGTGGHGRSAAVAAIIPASPRGAVRRGRGTRRSGGERRDERRDCWRRRETTGRNPAPSSGWRGHRAGTARRDARMPATSPLACRRRSRGSGAARCNARPSR